jgi:tetratricopeptide (TPR) repeat protein
LCCHAYALHCFFNNVNRGPPEKIAHFEKTEVSEQPYCLIPGKKKEADACFLRMRVLQWYMSFNTDRPGPLKKPRGEDRVAAAIAYLRQGFDAQAFLLLSGPHTEKDPAAQFALGLCHLRAGERDAAIFCFEQSLRLIKAVPGPGTAENSETYLALAKKQIEDELYLSPMDSGFCARFPKSAGDMVLLALICVYRQKGMTGQAQKLAAGLTGPAFEDYELPRRRATGYQVFLRKTCRSIGNLLYWGSATPPLLVEELNRPRGAGY